MSHKIRFPDLILFENDDFMIINKPSGISSLEDRTGRVSIQGLAQGYHPESQLCHRLDKETSGVLVIARNPEFYRHMAMQFEHREVKKIYHAVVDGSRDFTDLSADIPLAASSGGKARVDFKHGKPALTLFNTGKAFRTHTLVECMPITGRMHQIRVHLAWMKNPIVADNLYGGSPFLLSQIKKNYKLKKWEEEQSVIKRVALHAKSVSFTNTDSKTLDFEAPYPKDFNVILNQLEKYS